MSWASENKFLTGFGVVLLAGVGTLGYLTYSSMGNHEAAYGEFETSATELRRLQEVKPYPDDANLKELQAQKQDLGEKLAALQTALRSRTLKVEPTTKEKFQDTLKGTVAKIAAKAAEAKVTFPEGFYMDCAKYQATPPDEAAAPALGRQLRAMDLVVQILLAAGKIEVKDLKRDLLPEERGVAKPAAPKPAGGRPRPGQGADKDKPEKKLIDKTGFKITFTAPDKTFRQVLNNIVGHKEQLFVVRRLELKNTSPEPPPKIAAAVFAPDTPGAPAAPGAPGAPGASAVPGADPAAATSAPGAPPAPAPAPPGAPAAPVAPAVKPQGTLEYKFGTEKVEATLEIEILDFAEPEALPEKGGNRRDK
jgi:hypothetical protein